MVAKENARTTEAEELKSRFHILKEENEALYKRATAFQHIFERHDSLKARKEMFMANRDRMMDGMTVLNGENAPRSAVDHLDTTEELMHQFKNFETHLKSIVGKCEQQKDARDKEDMAINELERRERNLLSTQGELRTNRKVNLSACAANVQRRTSGTSASVRPRCASCRTPSTFLATTTAPSRTQRSWTLLTGSKRWFARLRATSSVCKCDRETGSGR